MKSKSHQTIGKFTKSNTFAKSNLFTMKVFFLCTIAILLLIVVGLFSYYLGSQNRQLSLSNQINALPQPTSVIIDPTVTPIFTVNPIKPTLPKLNIQPTQTISTAKKLSYYLPAGWVMVRDATDTIEVGYDPKLIELSDFTKYGSNQSKSINDLYVTLSGKWENNPIRKVGYNFTVAVRPYDGGSRHTFILGKNPLEWDKLNGYHEKEYIYNNWSCLVLYGIVMSQSDSIHGMCATSSTQALAFSIGGGTDSDMEKFISTIKLLK